jgi:hypothetical protein
MGAGPAKLLIGRATGLESGLLFGLILSFCGWLSVCHFCGGFNVTGSVLRCAVIAIVVDFIHRSIQLLRRSPPWAYRPDSRD